MLSKQSLHSACSIYIFHSELNVIACVVLGIAVSGLMLHLKAKELPNDPEFKASLGWYQNWKRRHSAERSKLWLNACPMTWKIRSYSFTAS